MTSSSGNPYMVRHINIHIYKNIAFECTKLCRIIGYYNLQLLKEKPNSESLCMTSSRPLRIFADAAIFPDLIVTPF